MTTNNFLGQMGGAARLLSMAMLCIAGCSSGNSGTGPVESSGSHWLACSDDGDCAAQGASSTCGAKGVCVDASGTPIEVMVTGGTGGHGGPGATAGVGVGGSSGAGGVGGTSSGNGPCAGKSCGDLCQTCPPGSKDCVQGVGACDATGTCTVGRTPTNCPDGGAGGVGGTSSDCTGACTPGTKCSMGPPAGSAIANVACTCSDEGAWCCDGQTCLGGAGGAGGGAGGGSGGVGGGGVSGGTPPGMCGTYAFPSFDKSCATDNDCIVKFHTIICCGTQTAWGVNAAARAAFESAETACDAAYPGCGCPTGATTAEDGKTSLAGDGSDFFASCTAGQCHSFVK